MIKQSYLSKESLNKKSWQLPWSGPFDGGVTAKANKMGISVDEFNRRNNIVRAEWTECKLREYCHYYPLDTEEKEAYGLCTVKKIYRSYWDFEKSDNWPKDDKPMIITIECEKLEGLVLCTNNWLCPNPITKQSC